MVLSTKNKKMDKEKPMRCNFMRLITSSLAKDSEMSICQRRPILKQTVIEIFVAAKFKSKLKKIKSTPKSIKCDLTL